MSAEKPFDAVKAAEARGSQVAFPSHITLPQLAGLTIREWLIGQALASLGTEMSSVTSAEAACRVADAALLESVQPGMVRKMSDELAGLTELVRAREDDPMERGE